MIRTKEIRKFTGFQVWLAGNYNDLPSDSGTVTDRAIIYLKERQRKKKERRKSLKSSRSQTPTECLAAGSEATACLPNMTGTVAYLAVVSERSSDQSKQNKSKDNMEKQRSKLYCWIMNIVDIRFWACECHYQAPYGKVIFGGCKKHD